MGAYDLFVSLGISGIQDGREKSFTFTMSIVKYIIHFQENTIFFYIFPPICLVDQLASSNKIASDLTDPIK